jgi:hypothetical protein
VRSDGRCPDAGPSADGPRWMLVDGRLWGNSIAGAARPVRSAGHSVLVYLGGRHAGRLPAISRIPDGSVRRLPVRYHLGLAASAVLARDVDVGIIKIGRCRRNTSTRGMQGRACSIQSAGQLAELRQMVVSGLNSRASVS